MKTDTKKILVIDNATAFTGAFKAIFTMSKHLESKFHFTFCIPTKSTLEKFLTDRNSAFITLPFLEITKSISVLLYFPVLIYNSIKLLSFISSKKIDILHVNDLYNMTGIVVKILYPRVKLVYHIRLMADSYAKPLYPFWVKIILRFADHVICNSFAVRKGLKTDSPKVQVIYDVPPSWENQQPLDSSIESSQITLLYLANFIPGKGHDFAVKSFAGAINEIPADTRMIMSGGGFNKKSNEAFKLSIIDQVKKLKLESRILITDFEPNVEQAMRRATIFLNFSESESFSLTCQEALSLGVPVIATDCGGPAELIENGKSGLLVRNRNVEEMKQAIIRLCNDKQLRQTFSQKGQEFIKSKFILSDILSEYISLYEN